MSFFLQLNCYDVYNILSLKWKVESINTLGRSPTVQVTQPLNCLLEGLYHYKDVGNRNKFTLRYLKHEHICDVNNMFRYIDLKTPRQLHENPIDTHMEFVDRMLVSDDENLYELFQRMELKDFFMFYDMNAQFQKAARSCITEKTFHIDPRYVPLWLVDNILQRRGAYIRKIKITYDESFNVVIPLIARYCPNIADFSVRFHEVGDERVRDDLGKIMRKVDILRLDCDTNFHDLIPSDSIFTTLYCKFYTGQLPAYRFANMIEVHLDMYITPEHSITDAFLGANPQIQRLGIHSIYVNLLTTITYPNLECLEIGRCESLRGLEKLPILVRNLKKVALFDVKNTVAARILKAIERGCNNLECLYLHSTKIDRHYPIATVERFIGLKLLHITNIGVRSLVKVLEACLQLHEFSINGAIYSFDDVEYIISMRTNVKIFRFQFSAVAGKDIRPICEGQLKKIDYIRKKKNINLQVHLHNYPRNLSGMEHAIRFPFVYRNE